MNDYIDRELEHYSRLLDESKEHLSNQAIAIYLNLKELLSEKEKKFIEKHIEVCKECKSRFDIIQSEELELLNIKDDLERLNESKKTKKIFPLQRLIKYAAAAVIFFGLLITADYIFLNKNTGGKKSDVVQQTDSLNNRIDSIKSPQLVEKEIDATNDIAFSKESFTENKTLENFIGRNMRSEKTVEIISPEIGSRLSSTIKFEWKRNNIEGPLTLTIIDNKNNNVYKETVDDSTLTLTKKLKQGLYYWKLSTPEKVEAVGKFYVNKN